MGYDCNHGDHQQMSLTPKKVSKVKGFDADASYSVEGADGGSFTIASRKKELRSSWRTVAH